MRPLRPVLNAAVLAVCVAGCSRSGAADVQVPIATIAPTASAEVSVVATETPVADERSVAGAERFVRRYINELNVAYSTGDTKAVTEYAADGCKACTNVAASLSRAWAGGGRTSGSQVAVQSVLPESQNIKAAFSVVAVVTISRYEETDADGEVVASAPAQPASSAQFDLTWTDEHWVVQKLSIRRL